MGDGAVDRVILIQELTASVLTSKIIVEPLPCIHSGTRPRRLWASGSSNSCPWSAPPPRNTCPGVIHDDYLSLKMVGDNETGVLVGLACVAVAARLVRPTFARGISGPSSGRIGSFAAATAASTSP